MSWARLLFVVEHGHLVGGVAVASGGAFGHCLLDGLVEYVLESAGILGNMLGDKRSRRGVAGVLLFALLTVLCALGPAFHSQMSLAQSPASSLLLVEEIADESAELSTTVRSQVSNDVKTVAVRAPALVSVIAFVSTLLGATLAHPPLISRPVFARGPDNPARIRLITIGIDRR